MCGLPPKEPTKTYQEILWSWKSQQPKHQAVKNLWGWRVPPQVSIFLSQSHGRKAGSEVKENQNNWKSDSKTPYRTEDFFTKVMLQNLQDLWTHRVLKSLLVPKPNVHTFFHNFSVTQQDCTRPWIYMVLVAARTLRGVERDRQQLLLHHVQVSEIVAHGTHSRVGNNHAQQQNRANRNENLTLHRYHSARHCKCRHC